MRTFLFALLFICLSIGKASAVSHASLRRTGVSTANAPLTISGGKMSCTTATDAVTGCMSSTDHASLTTDTAAVSAATNLATASTLAKRDASGNVAVAGLTATSVTDSGLTLGSVLFAGTGGLVNQSNAKLFWDNTNFRLGFNTTTPSVGLHLYNLDGGVNGTASEVIESTTQSAILEIKTNSAAGDWQVRGGKDNNFYIQDQAHGGGDPLAVLGGAQNLALMIDVHGVSLLGGFAPHEVTIAAGPYSSTYLDGQMLVTGNTAAVTINLPDNTLVMHGEILWIKDVDCHAVTYNITVHPATGQKIDQSTADVVLNTNCASLQLSAGAATGNWSIISKQ